MKKYYEEDQKLLKAVTNFKNGDNESYYVLYDLSIKYIYKIVYDIIKDHHATEDLVQETYLTIYKKIDSLEEVSKFYAWAGRIASNHTFRYIQKNKRELLTLDSEDGASEFAFEVATQDNEEFIPENILMDKEKQRIIAQIIDGLSAEQKLAVQYFYYEEMSVTEIAEAMGCARGTIMSRLNYARKAIKAAVVDLAENQGTKLYSLGALPLFYIVFRNSLESFVISTAATAAGTTATGAATGGGVSSAGTTAAAGKAVSAGGAAASGTVKGFLGKIGAGLSAKFAAGVLAAGLLTTGGILLHNAVTGEDSASDVKKNSFETTPMVVCLESVPNNETIDDFDDRFLYEYIHVIYNDREITVGYDEEIYQYGYDSYAALSPELKELHNEKYEEVVDVEEKKLKKVFDEEIEFTIDDEEFTLYVNDVEVVQDAEDGKTTIILTGDCDTPENANEIFEKYNDRYQEMLMMLTNQVDAGTGTDAETETDAEPEADTEPEADIDPELNAKNELIKEYFMGIMKDFVTYGTDPFGNSLEYIGPYAQAPEESPQVTHYAIYDMDGDGLVELVVRHTQGDIIYGYNPDTQVVVEEYKAPLGGKIVSQYDYYDSGFVVRDYLGYIEVFGWTEDTDVYDAKTSVWTCQGLVSYIYGEVGSYTFYENRDNADYIALEQEFLDEYDKDGDRQLWVEIENKYTSEEKVAACYDKADLEAKINEVVSDGKKIELEFISVDCFTVDMQNENTEPEEIGEEPEEESVVEPDETPEDAMNSYYEKIVEDFYLYGTDMYGFYYGDQPGDTSDYAICDMDGDGVEELIVRYHSHIFIYEYDSNAMVINEEYGTLVDEMPVTCCKFYENGYVVIDNGDIFVEKLNPRTRFHENLLSFYNSNGIIWNQMHANETISVEEYLSMYDADGNGVIYVEEVFDRSNYQYTSVYCDDADVETKIAETLEGNKALNIKFIDMNTVISQE